MSFLNDLADLLGPENLLTGDDLARYRADWTTLYPSNPCAVARPGSTREVSEAVRIAARHGVSVIPVGGLTGLTGAVQTDGGLMISVERLNRIREVNLASQVAVVEAGVVLSRLHDAAEEQGLYFPLWFGARGSAMIGGVLSTNAGGSNVLRYGSARALCLGLEVVLADGRVLDLMSQLRKDNSGYDLRQLFIGAEGTLGIITAAVVKLVPRPLAHATATLSARSLPDALTVLNRLQSASGGAVEAFEYMSRTHMARLAQMRPDIRQPFSPLQEVNILVELGTTSPRDTLPDDQGERPIMELMKNVLVELMEEGAVLDAEIAQNESQRMAMWERRELSAEICFSSGPCVECDIALPLDRVAAFLDRVQDSLNRAGHEYDSVHVAHLGDGNVHFSVFPKETGDHVHDSVMMEVEDVVVELGGSFSAEHGVGVMKLGSMARRKDPVALDVMRAIKAALDPCHRMNPGKVIPDRGGVS